MPIISNTLLKAHKLMQQRADGTLGPLFINCRQRIPLNEWLPAGCHPTKGFAVRPGWHVSPKPEAPHLTGGKNRVWCEVEIKGFKTLERPACQGGTWFIAKWMRVTRITT